MRPDYNLGYRVIVNWKQLGLLKELGTNKNKVLIDAKAVAVAATISRRFGLAGGSRAVTYALRFYNSLNPL